jgi:hypothetical protein
VKQWMSTLIVMGFAGTNWHSDRAEIRTSVSIDCDPIGRVLSVENDPQIELGRSLCESDTLQPVSNARVSVLCYEDGQVWNVPSGSLSTVRDRCSPVVAENGGCENYDPDGGCYPDSRSPDIGRLPVIIRPTDNRVLSQTPDLSWYAVDGALEYIVSVEDTSGSEPPQEHRFEASNTQSEMISHAYPFPRILTRGQRYRIRVEVLFAEATSSRDSHQEMRFNVASDEVVREVESIVSQLDRLPISEEERVLRDLYSVYTERDLIDDEIDRLEELVQQGSQNSEVYRKLEGLYYKQNLLDLAKLMFDRAEELDGQR